MTDPHTKPYRPFYASPDKTYEEQRKCRMQDAIDDYLQDDKISSKEIYEEIISCVDDVIHYHRAQLDRAQSVRTLMHGYREVPDRF